MVTFIARNMLRRAGSATKPNFIVYLILLRTGAGVQCMVSGKAWGDNQDKFKETKK